jgi:hypothetical protein
VTVVYPLAEGPVQTMNDISPYYEYIPTLGICILFTTLFALTTFIHLGQSLHYRMWYLTFTAVIAGGTEVMGWGGRLWSHYSPANLNPYLTQIITTTLAPTFLIASYFMILAEIIRRLGPRYSRLQPKMYAILFCGADLVALSVQGAGGGLAAIAVASNDPSKSPAYGGHIMLVGIVIQMIAVTIYSALAFEFVFRYVKDKPFQRPNNQPPTGNYSLDPAMKSMLFGLGISTALIYIRSVYRVIELSDGWSGHIITTEWYFNFFDATMIMTAMFCLNFFHPGRLLGLSTSLSEVDSINEDTLKKKGYA